MFKLRLIINVLVLLTLLLGGCEVLPVTRFKPTLHNPFPELTNVAVVPFYNHTGKPTADGREFALCYANELQRVPGFRVVSNEIVEKTMLEHELVKFEDVEDIRYLAQILKVDAVVIGKIHDFSSYYPPRVKLETEWFSVNPFLHPIPVGYGLPWGTEYEGFIPDKIALLAEKELATAQLKTQTPEYEPARSPKERKKAEQEKLKQEKLKQENQAREKRGQPAIPSKQAKKSNPIRQASATIPVDEMTPDMLEEFAHYRQEQFVIKNLELTGVPYIPDATPKSEEDKKKEALQYDPLLPHPFYHGPWPSEEATANQNPWSATNQYPMYQQGQMDPRLFQGQYPGWPAPSNLTPEQLAQYGWVNQQVAPIPNYYATMPGMPVEGQPGMIYGEPERFPGLPSDWPDPRGFIPEGPAPERPERKIKSDAPVLTHIALYKGNDAEFMQAMQDYDFLFRDDKRLAGKNSLLNNRSEFIEICCRMHIWEMLGARGGAGQAEKVVREWKLWQGGTRPY